LQLKLFMHIHDFSAGVDKNLGQIADNSEWESEMEGSLQQIVGYRPCLTLSNDEKLFKRFLGKGLVENGDKLSKSGHGFQEYSFRDKSP